MDPATALTLVGTTVNLLLQYLPTVIKDIQDLKPFAASLFEKFTGQTITEDQRVMVEAKIDELHTEFQQPIPPDDQQ